MCSGSAFPSCILPHHYRVCGPQPLAKLGNLERGQVRQWSGQAGIQTRPTSGSGGNPDRLTSNSIPEPLRAQSCRMPGWLQDWSFTCPCFSLLENSFLKLGITWFQGPAFKIPGRPASTFHRQPCLSQTWVPLPQFLQWVFSILHAVESSPVAK